MDEPLVVDSVEESMGEAARKALGKLKFLMMGKDEGPVGGKGIDGRAVGLGGGGNVLGALEPALDLEAANAGAGQLGDHVVGGKVLRAEEIGFIAEVADRAVDDEVVRQSAGLGALAAVGAAPAERFAGEALAAVGHAEGAMDEDFDRQIGGRADLKDVADRQFAGKNDALHAKSADKFDAQGLGEGHLCRAMDRQCRAHPPDKLGQTQILHDDGVDPGQCDGPDEAQGIVEFIGENQGVECDIAADIAAMQVSHHLGQPLQAKSWRPGNGR